MKTEGLLRIKSCRLQAQPGFGCPVKREVADERDRGEKTRRGRSQVSGTIRLSVTLIPKEQAHLPAPRPALQQGAHAAVRTQQFLLRDRDLVVAVGRMGGV